MSYIKRALNILSSSLNRRDFLRGAGMALGSMILFNKVTARANTDRTLKARPRKSINAPYDLVSVKGDNIEKITRQAVNSLGGMGKFVKSGDIVVIKPNIGWNRDPRYAANTNPAVVSTLVKMCREAGAKTVKVFDRTCNSADMCYDNSGIEKAVKSAGGSVYHVADWKFMPGEFPSGSLMKDWPVFRDAVECDCFINVPVAKHHGLTGLTLSMKNLMGVCGGNRGKIHVDIDKKLCELTQFFNPELTVIDAYRILLRHGPSGGNLKDVKLVKTVIAGTDPLLADAYAATFFGMNPESIGYIKKGSRYGIGNSNIATARIKKIQI